MQTFDLSNEESHVLRTTITQHDIDNESGMCACGHHVDLLNYEDREEHLLEVAFRAGELHAIMHE